jgi:putative tricarboxylic transport membrane protein
MFAKNMLADRLGGLFSIVVGIISIVEGGRLYPSRMSPMVGDHTMPILLGAILLILGLLMFFIRMESFIVQHPVSEIRNVITLTLLLMFGYCFLIQYLGYLIPTFLVGACLFRIFGSYKWIKCILMSAASTICLDLIFIQWLRMPFPTGVFNI